MLPANAPNEPTREVGYLDDYGTDIDRPVVIRVEEYPAGYTTYRHWHRWNQLAYATSGVVTVTTAQDIWVVPPQRAVWIPARIEHDIRTTGSVSMRNTYIGQREVPWLPSNCCVVTVTPLLRELISRAANFRQWYELNGHQERIMTLLLDEIKELPLMPLHLPEPNDSRLKTIAALIRQDPADRRTLEEWGRKVGASSRTLSRLFLADTGMTFRHWQRQARLVDGLIRLAKRQSVTEVALELGYESPSAFIAMFRRALGVTPGQYFTYLETRCRDGIGF